MGGYLPLGLASLLISSILVATKLIFIDNRQIPFTERIILALPASFPYCFALLVVSPYLYAVYCFHHETSSASAPNLFYSAHQLAELPQGLLRVFSTHLSITSPLYEIGLSWGIIAILVAAIFFLSAKASDALTSSDWSLFKVAAVVYFATVLAIFGVYSPVSDLFYYLLPQIGKMHIYQRFLFPVNLLFCVLLALMLKGITAVRPPIAIRIIGTIMVFCTVLVALIVSSGGAFIYNLKPNNYLIFELILGCLFIFSLFVPGKYFVYFTMIVLSFITPLGHMYEMLTNLRTPEISMLNPDEKNRFSTYLKRFDKKQIIKYVDVTSLYTAKGEETFFKDYPYFMLPAFRLSSYGGFTFYLSGREDYMKHMPVIDSAVAPDWEYINNSGADFVIASEVDTHFGFLSELRKKAAPNALYKLPNDAIVIPLDTKDRRTSSPVLFDNGYLSVTPLVAEHAVSAENLAKGKIARQSGEGGGNARLAVDGNTEGNFSSGSVTHTNCNPNAWLELDLGSIQTIDAIRIWNRTDCCAERLHDYWVFVSEKPFLPTDTVPTLLAREKIWKHLGPPAPNPKMHACDRSNPRPVRACSIVT